MLNKLKNQLMSVELSPYKDSLLGISEINFLNSLIKEIECKETSVEMEVEDYDYLVMQLINTNKIIHLKNSKFRTYQKSEDVTEEEMIDILPYMEIELFNFYKNIKDFKSLKYKEDIEWLSKFNYFKHTFDIRIIDMVYHRLLLRKNVINGKLNPYELLKLLPEHAESNFRNYLITELTKDNNTSPMFNYHYNSMETLMKDLIPKNLNIILLLLNILEDESNIDKRLLSVRKIINEKIKAITKKSISKN